MAEPALMRPVGSMGGRWTVLLEVVSELPPTTVSSVVFWAGFVTIFRPPVDE